MKKVILGCVVLLLLNSTATVLAMQSAGYVIESNVISAGGGASASSGYRLESTVGQALAAGVSSSSGFQVMSGFWSKFAHLITGGDVNGDGEIDLEDAVMVLQMLTGLPVGGIHKSADINGDQVIGVQEAIYLLQKVAASR